MEAPCRRRQREYRLPGEIRLSLEGVFILTPYSLAHEWRECHFKERPNRFTLVLESRGRTVKAYVRNTGRLEEYLVEGTPFYIAPFRSEKFRYMAVSTRYQDNYVLLDTLEMNSIVNTLLNRRALPGIDDIRTVTAERTVGSSRFDFVIERSLSLPLIVEVKTCTLVHNGVAMFPDAPTMRATSHMHHMSKLSREGFEAVMLFIIPNGGARLFIPNFHTDPLFSQSFEDEMNVQFRAYRLKLIDPVTVDLDTLCGIPINTDLARRCNKNSGSYLIVLHSVQERKVEVGSLGRIIFRKGYYVYVGSGLQGLEARAARHGRTRKKKFWHIDHVSPSFLRPVKTYLIRRPDRIESDLAERISLFASGETEGFGATDSGDRSHLFYFENPPFRNHRFISAVLDYRTFTEIGNSALP
jgi:sugar fermentation stimulation protein A